MCSVEDDAKSCVGCYSGTDEHSTNSVLLFTILNPQYPVTVVSSRMQSASPQRSLSVVFPVLARVGCYYYWSM